MVLHDERSFGAWLFRALFVVFLLVRLGALVAVGISFLPKFSAADQQMQIVLIALLADLGASIFLWVVDFGAKLLRKRGKRALLLAPLLLLAVFVLSIVAAGMEQGTAQVQRVEMACLGLAALYLLLSHLFVVLDLTVFFKGRTDA